MDHQTCSVADSDKRKKPRRERRRVVWIDCQKSQIEVMQYPDVTTLKETRHACLPRETGAAKPKSQSQNPTSPRVRHKLLRLPQDTSPPPDSPTKPTQDRSPVLQKIYTSFPHNHSITTKYSTAKYRLARLYVPAQSCRCPIPQTLMPGKATLLFMIHEPTLQRKQPYPPPCQCKYVAQAQKPHESRSLPFAAPPVSHKCPFITAPFGAPFTNAPSPPLKPPSSPLFPAPCPTGSACTAMARVYSSPLLRCGCRGTMSTKSAYRTQNKGCKVKNLARASLKRVFSSVVARSEGMRTPACWLRRRRQREARSWVRTGRCVHAVSVFGGGGV